MRRIRHARSGGSVGATGRRADRGATGLEYGLLIAGSSVVAVLGLSTLGQATADNLSCFTQQFADPSSTCGGGSGSGSTGTSGGSSSPDPDPVQTPREPTPSDSPTAGPTDSPTPGPTDSPTAGPTDSPTAGPTDSPTPTTQPPTP